MFELNRNGLMRIYRGIKVNIEVYAVFVYLRIEFGFLIVTSTIQHLICQRIHQPKALFTARRPTAFVDHHEFLDLFLFSGPYVMVYHTGEVVFPVLMKLRTTCKVNIQYFPFDRQVCGLKFASWIYDRSSINYELLAHSNDQQQSESIRNSGWEILDVKQDLVWRYV